MFVLIAVVDEGSLTAAARVLGMPLATVSRKIGELEAHLGTRLFHRTTRQVSLTESGSSYVAACRRILEDIGEAERAVTGEYASPRGDLSVTAPIVFGRLHIVPVVAEFLAHYPEINVNLMLTDRVVHMVDEQIDIALRIGDLPDSALVATQVGTVRRVVCASSQYLDVHGAPKIPQDLGKHQCIAFEVMASMRAWAFGQGKSEISIPVRPRLTVNTAEAAIDASVLGVGLIRVLSYQVDSAVCNGSLEIVLDNYETAPLPVNLVHKGKTPKPLKLRSFLDFAISRLRHRMESVP